ncbi:MAG: hypothetical protein IJA69_04525 [Clostridia bacterium]|nr:hypothetical protein [Clostridia bacterium]
MKEREFVGNCKCCGAKVELDMGKEDFDFNAFNLTAYKKYKEFDVSRCEHCDYVSDNILTDEAPDVVHEVISSADYQFVLGYEYILGEGEFDEWEYELSAFNANEFEAYALILDALGDYENEIRALSRCVELKRKLIRRLKKIANEEYGDEDYFDEVDKICKLLELSINMNNEQIVEIYADIKTPNKFSELIYVEALAGLGEAEIAQAKLENISQNKQLPQDISDYFKSIIK